MAATCQLENKGTGEKVWRYSVDAKEILSAPGSPWRLTGSVRRSGWATPSGPRERLSAAKSKDQAMGATVGQSVVEALVKAGVIKAQAAPAEARAVNEDEPSDEKPTSDPGIEAPKGFEDGLPPEEEEDSHEAPLDLLS